MSRGTGKRRESQKNGQEGQANGEEKEKLVGLDLDILIWKL